jgi:hypothetical protein
MHLTAIQGRRKIGYSLLRVVGEIVFSNIPEPTKWVVDPWGIYA